ncbi:MAG: hypothetical protein COA43_11865 [Robiginitomaculum sp.]|nr:MAG: hypothetical protein COA43_11865 [Robiginitomaculum sp.]
MLDEMNTNTASAVHNAQMGAGNLTRIQKAAIIIAMLGPETAKPLISAIEDRHMRAFVLAMEELPLVPRPVLLATVADFITNMNARSGSIRGGEEQARKLLEGLLDSDRATRLLTGAPDQPLKTCAADATWEKLANEKAEKVADYLNSQRPEVISIVLSSLSAAKAGEILGEMSDEAAETGGYLMAEGSNADDSTKDAIAEVIELELLTEDAGDANGNSASFMSDLMGVLPRGRRDRLMDVIEEKNPVQADLIRRGLLTFEDLPTRLPKSAIPIIFRDMEKSALLAALKAGDSSDPMTVGFLYGNISQRMADQYKEDASALAPMTDKESDNAIIAVMSFISSLEKAGTIAYIEATESSGGAADFAMDIDLPTMDAEEGE